MIFMKERSMGVRRWGWGAIVREGSPRAMSSFSLLCLSVEDRVAAVLPGLRVDVGMITWPQKLFVIKVNN